MPKETPIGVEVQSDIGQNQRSDPMIEMEYGQRWVSLASSVLFYMFQEVARS
jgi:hypothetical protein